MLNSLKYIFILLIGGFGYAIIEILFRGYTHWSMVLTGGAAFLSLYLIDSFYPRVPIYLKAFFGMIIITTMELFAGIVVNKIFHFGVWDYTNMFGNLLGQISLPFSACWYGLSLVLFALFKTVNQIIFQLQLGKS
jgi:uncharacterized membrane protein